MSHFAGGKKCKDDKLEIQNCKFFSITYVLRYNLRSFASDVYILSFLDLFARKNVTCTDYLAH